MIDKLTPDQFDELVADWSPRLLAYLTRFLRDKHLAEDVLQETLLKASKSYDPSRPPGPWLFKVATTTAVDLLRRRKYQNKRTTDLVDDLPGSEPDPRDEIEKWQDIQWIRRVIHSLPPDLRATVEAVTIEGKTFKEAAEALETPVSTLKSRMTLSIPNRLRSHDRATLVQLPDGRRTYSYGSTKGDGRSRYLRDFGGADQGSR